MSGRGRQLVTYGWHHEVAGSMPRFSVLHRPLSFVAFFVTLLRHLLIIRLVLVCLDVGVPLKV